MSVDVEKFCTPEANRFREKIAKDNSKFSPTAYELEGACFRLAPFGHGGKNMGLKWQFELNCFRFQWPETMLLEVGEYDNFWAKRMIRGLCRWKTLSLVGSASAGKTFICAAHAYTFWKFSPWNTSCYLSTTTSEASHRRTWGAIKDLQQRDKFPVGTLLEYRHMLVLQEDPNDKSRDYRDSISAVTIPKGQEGQNVVGAISGGKNQHIIWVADELSFMDAGVLMARLNLRANPFFQFIGISNKPREGDPMYQDAEPKGAKYPFGWRSVNPDVDDAWTTQAGCCYYFDGERSPNMKVPAGKPAPFPGLMTEAMRADIEADSGGTDSIGYWTQVRGFPQSGEVQDTVLNGNLIESRECHHDPIWGMEQPVCIAGLDLGFRADGDPCVADFGLLGRDTSGSIILAHEKETVQLRTSMASKLSFEEQIAEHLIQECKTRNCHEIEIDISADGGIIAQAIDQKARALNYKLQLHLCSFMGRPDDNVYFEVGGKRKPATELFDRKVSQLWYSYRFNVQNSAIRGLNVASRAVKQLCQRKVWQDDRKRWCVERKTDMKKRIKRSCDDGDARVLCANLAVRKGLKGSGRRPVESRNVRQQDAKPASRPYGSRHSGRHYASR